MSLKPLEKSNLGKDWVTGRKEKRVYHETKGGLLLQGADGG